MNHKLACFLFLLIVNQYCFGQYKEVDGAPVENISKFTFLNPGFSFEKSIGQKQSLSLHVFMQPSGYFSYSDALGTDAKFFLDPALAFNYRYYYNGAKRHAAGKPTHLNNMNYLAGIFEAVFSKMAIGSAYFEEDERRAINRVGIVWGMHRNFPKRFSLDLSAGLGYQFTKGITLDDMGNQASVNISKVIGLTNLTLGIWLNKRKDKEPR